MPKGWMICLVFCLSPDFFVPSFSSGLKLMGTVDGGVPLIKSPMTQECVWKSSFLDHDFLVQKLWPCSPTFVSEKVFESWIDVTLTSSRLSHFNDSWEVFDDTPLASDHFVISCSHLDSLHVWANERKVAGGRGRLQEAANWGGVRFCPPTL